MEAILINPQSESQSNVLTALLREMNIPFTFYNTNEVDVSDEELRAIDLGLDDLSKGNMTAHDDAKKIFHDAIYKVD